MNAQLKAAARHSFITEMTVFTLETDYSCETGYPFDNSREIGNTSYCAFHKHANSEFQKPTDDCVFRCRQSS